MSLRRALVKAAKGPHIITEIEGALVVEPLRFIPLHSTAHLIAGELMLSVHARPEEARCAA